MSGVTDISIWHRKIMTLQNTDHMEAIQTSSWTAFLDDNHRMWCFVTQFQDNGYAVCRLFSHARDRHMNRWGTRLVSSLCCRSYILAEVFLSAKKPSWEWPNVNLFAISLDLMNIMHFYSDYPRYGGFLIARTRRLRCSCIAIVFWEESYCHALILCQTSHAQ